MRRCIHSYQHKIITLYRRYCHVSKKSWNDSLLTFVINQPPTDRF